MIRLALVGTLLAAPTMVLAHGGEDHGAKTEAAPATTGDLRSVGATGDLYEVLVKHSPSPAGKPAALRIYVADARTNEPIAGAEVELTLSGVSETKVTAQRTDNPGIYLASVVLPPENELDLVASVSRGSDADLIALGQLRIGPDPAGPAQTHSHRPPRWPLLGGSVLLIVIAGAVTLRLLRARRKAQELARHA